MKKLWLLLLPLSLNAATVTNYITDGFGNPLVTRVVITPFTVTTVFGGTNVLGPSAGFDCTNGAWQASLLAGFYYVDQNLGQPVIRVWATPGDTNYYSLAQMASAATNPIPSFFSPGTYVPGTNQQFVLTQWAGPSNTLAMINGFQYYSTATATSITNVTGIDVGQFRWSTAVLSNSLNTSITQWCTVPGIRFYGTQSTNALIVAAHKQGIWSFLTVGGLSTNCVNAPEQ